MPAPVIYEGATDTILNGQKVFTTNKANIAQSAFFKMSAYDPIGGGTFGNTFEWACPDGPTFIFSSSNGEIYFNGTPYSSLGAEDKAAFHKWLPQFSKQFVIKYNREFGI